MIEGWANWLLATVGKNVLVVIKQLMQSSKSSLFLSIYNFSRSG